MVLKRLIDVLSLNSRLEVIEVCVLQEIGIKVSLLIDECLN